MTDHIRANAIEEILYRRQEGIQRVTLKEMAKRYAELGYRFDRSMDCHCVSQYKTGPRAGKTHRLCSLYPVQISDGQSAFHYQSRRDENYRKMTELRNTIYAFRKDVFYEV